MRTSPPGWLYFTRVVGEVEERLAEARRIGHGARDRCRRREPADPHLAALGDRADARDARRPRPPPGRAPRGPASSRPTRSSTGRAARRRAGRGDRSRARSGSRSRASSAASSTVPELSVSASSLIEVSGVRSSWLMLATKSRRTRSMRRSAVMSCSDRTSPPSSSGTASTANCRAPRRPRSASPRRRLAARRGLPRHRVERGRPEGGDEAHPDQRRARRARRARPPRVPARTIRSRSSTRISRSPPRRARSASKAAAGGRVGHAGRGANA